MVVVTTAAKELIDRQKEREIERREGIQKAPERCQACEGISSFYAKELAVNGLSERAKIKKKEFSVWNCMGICSTRQTATRALMLHMSS